MRFPNSHAKSAAPRVTGASRASLSLAAMALLASAACGSGAPSIDPGKLPPALARQVDFASDIKPIFEANCYKCHGPEKQKSAFRLDVKAVALKGGEKGQDILPGKSSESPLIHFVAGLVEDMQMPAKGERLTAEQIGLLRAWIDQGAPWPESADTAKARDKADHWAFKPAVRSPVPKAKNQRWPRNELDRFILARLEKEGLKPSPEADRRTLIRRLSFDLHGLPPTPEDVKHFLADNDRKAYENLVDRLLASPRYGERWGRHWLDVVHYGESHGYDKDKPRLNAWPYRDYVIKSLNDDKPYARFVQEQLAGDVLWPDDPLGVVATGLIAAGPWDFVGHVELPESKTDGLIARYNDRDDMVTTATSTFLSLTVGCARCHDHKFDPITQRDYYSLQAVFAGVDRAERVFDDDPKVFVERKGLLAEKKQLDARLKALEEIVAKVTSSEIERLEAQLKTTKDELAALPKPSKESPSNGYHSAIEPTPDKVKWVQVDLVNRTPIDEVRLIPARPTDFPDTLGFGFPPRFRVEVSDDEDFREKAVLVDHTGADFTNPGDSPFVVSGKGQRGRFVRVTATRLWERTKDFVFALAELEVYAGTNNLAPGTRVTALDSIEAGRWGAAKLVDKYDSRKSLTQSPEPPEITAKRKELENAIRTQTEERKAEVESRLDEATKTGLRATRSRLDELAKEVEALPKPRFVYAAAPDFAPSGSFKPPIGPRPIHLLNRGDVKQPREPVSPAALGCVANLSRDLGCGDPTDEGARRAALARWITDSKNLLSRRSIVNRVWHYHFGRGLVDTPNDFGHMGAPPSHPELLDWLAYWFLDNGESLKKLHRLILTSATWRQASDVDSLNRLIVKSVSVSKSPAKEVAGSTVQRFNGSTVQRSAAAIDSDNRLLWRQNRQRLDAEAFRDALLVVNGKLDLTMGGPSIQQFHFKDDHSPVYDYTRFDAGSPGAYRRSVYRFIVRSVPDPFMECMDCADPNISTPKRNTTLTALQALSSLNNPFVIKQAEHLAERASAASEPKRQIELIYECALNRAPTSEEAKELGAYARRHGLSNACRLIFNSNEFMFVD